jgi:hypothetical protein
MVAPLPCKQLFLRAVVIVPVALVLNEGTLRIFRRPAGRYSPLARIRPVREASWNFLQAEHSTVRDQAFSSAPVSDVMNF